MNLKDTIRHKMSEFSSLCQAHNVKSLYAFGSSVTDEFEENSSDIDLLIEIENDDPIERGENLLNIWDKFEQFFQRKVDLLTNNSIKNPILRKNIDATKILIYDDKSKKYLSDILRAIQLIEDFTVEITDFNNYENDLKTQSAVERQLVIIGEALNKLKKTEPTIIIENDKQIVGFRNRLVHAYDSIDNSIVWAILHRHLIYLKKEIETLNS